MNNKLKEKFKNKALPYVKEIKALAKQHNDKVVDQVTLGQLYGGMRDVLSIATETSLLDADAGISFRGYSIDDIYKILPKSPIDSKQASPEFIFYLLLTGEIPTTEEIEALSAEWRERQNIPTHVYNVIDSFPNTSHPMTVFCAAIASLETESIFNKAYASSVPKDTLWEYAYEDSMNLIATLPKIVAYIYNRFYNDNVHISRDFKLDWAGNLAHMLGDTDSSPTSLKKEYLRLHLFLHSDHEGANASAFTAHVTGSTLASPYGSFAAGMHSLSGPLHGLASQNSLSWIQQLVAHFGNKIPNDDQIAEYINNVINNGGVVPGYGHAVLRKTDPRFTAQMMFAKKNKMDDQLLQAVWKVYDIAPKILGSIAKIKNPFPNVDAHSGAMLNNLGFKNPEFYTVLFGASRGLGILSQQIWDRAFGHPIHRPKSITSDWMLKNIK